MIYKTLFFVFALLVLVCGFSSAEDTQQTSPIRRAPLRDYPHWLSLLDAVNVKQWSGQDLHQIQEIKTKITDLSSILLEEEGKLLDLVHESNALKSPFWFFEHTLRREIEDKQLRINDQFRVVESIREKIAAEWRHVKPYYGVFSKLFLTELVLKCNRLIIWVMETVLAFFAVELLILILGPFALLFSLTWLALGFSLFLNLLASFGMLAFTIYWIFVLPEIIIHYNPSLAQFLIVYGSIIGTLSFLTAFSMGAFKKRKNENARTSTTTSPTTTAGQKKRN